jgi:hypothetical protein
MTEESKRAGLGKVIYSVDETEEQKPSEKREEKAESASVEVADRQSFPASDPPGFSGAKEKKCD